MHRRTALVITWAREQARHDLAGRKSVRFYVLDRYPILGVEALFLTTQEADIVEKEEQALLAQGEAA